MRRTLSLLLVLVAVALAYWWANGTPGVPSSPGSATTGTAAPVAQVQPPPGAPAGSSPAPVAEAPVPAQPPRIAQAARHAAQVEREAKRFVARISANAVDPVGVARADTFAHADQMLALNRPGPVKTTTLRALTEQHQIGAHAPITVVHTQDQVEMSTPERVYSLAHGNLDMPIRIIGKDGAVHRTTVGKVLERYAGHPGARIPLVRAVPYYEITTLAKLAAKPGADPDAPLHIIPRPFALGRVSLGELLSAYGDGQPKGTVFYLRTVNASDRDGIWGIVRDGLTKNFARGMAIVQGKRIDTYRVDIPRDADQLHANRSSSFLGRLIWRKTVESYVYNYRFKRMGRDPNRIRPGEQLVIIAFRPKELLKVYRHFRDRDG